MPATPPHHRETMTTPGGQSTTTADRRSDTLRALTDTPPQRSHPQLEAAAIQRKRRGNFAQRASEKKRGPVQKRLWRRLRPAQVERATESPRDPFDLLALLLTPAGSTHSRFSSPWGKGEGRIPPEIKREAREEKRLFSPSLPFPALSDPRVRTKHRRAWGAGHGGRGGREDDCAHAFRLTFLSRAAPDEGAGCVAIASMGTRGARISRAF